jgi:hypothetical protein
VASDDELFDRVEQAMTDGDVDHRVVADDSGRRVLHLPLPPAMENPVAPYSCFAVVENGDLTFWAKHELRLSASEADLQAFTNAFTEMTGGVYSVTPDGGAVWTRWSVPLTPDPSAVAVKRPMTFRRECAAVSMGLQLMCLGTPVQKSIEGVRGFHNLNADH